MIVSEIFEVAKLSDFIFALSTFLDEFINSNDKAALINDKPVVNNSFKTESCIVAAVVHKLATSNNILIPEWVFDKEYILDQPYYQFNTNNVEYQEYLRSKSPMEFRQRNIFVDDNALTRV